MGTSRGILLAFFVSTLTFWKTVAFVLRYTHLCNGGHLLAHVSWGEMWLWFLFPNTVWIACSFLCICYFGRLLGGSLKEKRS